jgi:hypothetical protein
LNVFGFADDICLLTDNINDMQKLLNICAKFGEEYAIEFNLDKCFFIVFGTQRLDNTKFCLNNIQLKLAQNWKYLGIDFNYNIDL